MAVLRELVHVEVAILAACLGAAVFWKLLRGVLRAGRQHALYILLGRGGMGRAIRLQLTVGSVAFALLYLASTLRAAGSGALPPVSDYALALLGGSQAAFLGAAIWSSLRRTVTLRNEGEK